MSDSIAINDAVSRSLGQVSIDLTGVEDKASFLDRLGRLLHTWGYAAIFVAIAVIIVVFTFNYWAPLRRLVGRFSPQRRQRAAFLQKIVDGSQPIELIGAEFRNDPANDAAWRKVRNARSDRS